MVPVDWLTNGERARRMKCIMLLMHHPGTSLCKSVCKTCTLIIDVLCACVAESMLSIAQVMSSCRFWFVYMHVPSGCMHAGCVTDRDISREMLCRLPAGCRVVFISDYAHSGPCMELAHNITAAPATPAKPSTPSQRPASAGAAPRGGIVREWSGQQQVEPCEAELIAIIGSSAGRNAAGLAGGWQAAIVVDYCNLK